MKIFQNFYLKFISILLGVTLWLYVQGRDTVETSAKLALFFSNLNENYYLDDISGTEITVWIKGAKPVISQLLKAEKRLEINLKGYKEGRYTVTITPSMIGFSKNIEVTRIQPEKIMFRLRPIAEKRVPVKVDYEGHALYHTSPSFVTIKGERKHIEGVNYVVTEPIVPNKKNKNIKVKLVNPGGNVKIIPESVDVIFK